MMEYLQVILSFVILFSSSSQAFSYKDQDNWPDVFCKKAVAQSPIDIQTKATTKIKASPLVFINWDQEYNTSVRNTGYTVQVNFPCSSHISVSGGNLPGTFNIIQFHFHWGSEHTVNGQRLALEAHFVGYNNKYDSDEEALPYKNGIAVVTVLYDFSEKENTELQPILKQIGKLTKPGQATNIKINPAKFLPNDVSQFYRYDGSLTTPNCNDVVVWTIFTEYRKVNRNQIDKFRTLRNSEGDLLTENVRKIQPLNGRTVFEIST